MSAIPKTIHDAIATSVHAMTAPLGVPSQRIDAALRSLFAELSGETASAVADTRPLDRAVSRRQAAELLGCSCVSISRKVAAGRLRGIYGGETGQRLTGISSESLRELLNRRKGGVRNG